jgi:hypothetical protein
MRMRAPALLLLALWMAPPAVEAGLFGGSSNQKKLPKPRKMVEIKSYDAAKYAKVHKLYP